MLKSRDSSSLARRGILTILRQAGVDFLLGALKLHSATRREFLVRMQEVISQVDAGAVKIGSQPV